VSADPACPATPRDPDSYDTDSPTVERRDLCDQCFPDGIPDHISEVVVGERYTSSVHLPDELADRVEHNPAVTAPDEYRHNANGIAAKIGAEDFGPEDIGLDPSGGDA